MIAIGNLKKVINFIGRDNLGEYLGSVVFLAIKQGCIANKIVHSSSSLMTNLGIGIGVMVGFYISNSVGGGQMNSAVTLALCTIGHMKWKKLLSFTLVHFLACFTTSFMMYGVYYQRIKVNNIPDSKSIHILTTTLESDIHPMVAFAEQFLAMSMVMIGVLTIIEKNSELTDIKFHPLTLGLLVTGVLITFASSGVTTIHPNLDITGRIVASMVGYDKSIWKFPYFIIPPISLCLGSLFGTFIYQIFLGAWISQISPDKL